jgi:histidinol phosphatase-like PHP family hydrolase
MKKTKKHPVLADMHTHLNEKKIKPKEYWKAAKQKKLSIIAITEHSNYKPKDAYLKLKTTKPKKILLIPGLEAKTTAGDLLIYGTNESIYEIKELMQTNIQTEHALQITKENNFLASFAHPYGYKADSACEVIGEEKTKKFMQKYGAGAEYYNGMLASANELLFRRKWAQGLYKALNFFEKNKAAKKLKLYKGAEKTKKKMEKLATETLNRVKKSMMLAEKADFLTVGSDAHYPHSIGSSIIELKTKPKNEKEFLEMIKEKETLWKGPNIYSKNPVDIIGKKEMLEGITYLTKKNVLKKRKNPLTSKISKKIRLSKRIKTIKRITKKAQLTKIRTKIRKIKVKQAVKKIKLKKVKEKIIKKLSSGMLKKLRKKRMKK